MAVIADYDSLVAAAKIYCARSDTTFSNMMPVFVAHAEDRLYNGHADDDDNDPLYSPPLRSSVMEASGTLTAAGGLATLPDDYLLIRKLVRSGDSLGLTYMPPERVAVAGVVESSSTPIWFTIEGKTLELIPSWDGDLDITYYRRFDAITSTNQTGPLIIQHGLAYLEAVLIEAFAWMANGDLSVGHAAKLRGLVKGYNRASSELRFSGPLRVRQRQWVP